MLSEVPIENKYQLLIMSMLELYLPKPSSGHILYSSLTGELMHTLTNSDTPEILQFSMHNLVQNT